MKKLNYTTPEVEVIELSVEMGFAASGEATGGMEGDFGNGGELGNL